MSRKKSFYFSLKKIKLPHFNFSKLKNLKIKFPSVTLMNVRRVFWVAMGILGSLLLASLVILAVRIANFSAADNREVSLSSKIHDDQVDLFDVQYTNANGQITVAGMDGEKVLAHGTKVEYTIRIRNTDSVAIDYCLGTDLVQDSKYALPIVVRMLDPEDNYILGNEKTWVSLDELEQINYRHTLMSGEAAEYVFQWKWPYESGDDEYDTFLGNLTQDVSLQISLSVSATANTGIYANGGWIKSGAIYNIALILLAILLLASMILLLLTVLRRKVIPAIVEVLAPQEPEPELTPVIPQPRPLKERATGRVVSVNLDVLQKHFIDGDEVSLRIMKRKGLLPKNTVRMKVLANNGDKLDKQLTVCTQGISSQARKIIIEAGGTVVITKD